MGNNLITVRAYTGKGKGKNLQSLYNAISTYDSIIMTLLHDSSSEQINIIHVIIHCPQSGDVVFTEYVSSCQLLPAPDSSELRPGAGADVSVCVVPWQTMFSASLNVETGQVQLLFKQMIP